MRGSRLSPAYVKNAMNNIAENTKKEVVVLFVFFMSISLSYGN